MKSRIASNQNKRPDWALDSGIADCHFPSLAQNLGFVQPPASRIAYLLTRKLAANRLNQFPYSNFIFWPDFL
jgi:hypothetical protein